MRVEQVRISRLKKAKYNPRRMPKAEMEKLKRSLKEFGFVEPVVISKDNTIVGGHQRVAAARALNWREVPCLRLKDLTPKREKALNLALNRISGEWDGEKLAEIFTGFRLEDNLDEVLCGFDPKEIDRILEEFGGAENKTALASDIPPILKGKTSSRRGAIYQLGRHRLLCGDCGDPRAVKAIVGNAAISAVLTDPPYGINQFGVPNDGAEQQAKLTRDAVANLPLRDGVVAAFQSTRTFPVWLDAIRQHGHRFERALTLYKEAQCAKPWRGWILKSELLLLSSLGKARWQEAKPYAHDTYKIAEVSPRSENSAALADDDWHGSVKPLSVVEDLLRRICPPGGFVFDPFLGSGTTLMAAQREGRTCFGLEIHPAYCDVIRRRWAFFLHGKDCDWETLTPCAAR